MRYASFLKSLAVIPLVASIVLATSCQQNTESALAGIKPLNPAGAVVPVRVVRTSTGYELQRGGKPYHIKGVAGVQHLDLIRQKGGNSVRIYTANYADILLDEAHRNGLTVMFGLWMRPSYEKFDYYDPKAVAMQQQQIYEQVLRYKNHPSLLMWNLGNELNNHTLDMKVYQVVNETAQVIHRLDPNHPVTTTLTSSTFPIPAIARLCPDLDVITINVFNTLGRHAQDLKAAGWSGPFVIGEFGGRGWWEAPQTSWGAPLDQSGSEKAELMGRNYESTVASNGSHCLGSYALYWGNRFEQTDMWLSMFAPTGEKTPMVDMMQYLWTKTEPENQAPKVGVMLLDSKPDSLSVALKPNLEYTASVSAFDPDGDSLAVQWKVTRDVDEFHTLPQNRTAPEAIPSAIRQAKGTTALIRAPAQEGAYRLLVNVYDKKGSVTTNSFPFYVGQPKRPDVVVSTGK